MWITKEQFEQIYSEYADAIFRHCYFRVYSRALARDLMQDTFMKTWQYIVDKDGKIEQIRPFLYRVCNNLIIDWSRKKKESSLDDMAEDGFDAPDPTANRQTDPAEYDHLQKLLKKINPKYREAVVLRYIEDLRPREIAEVLGISENLASVRIHHGLQQLRSLYDYE